MTVRLLVTWVCLRQQALEMVQVFQTKQNSVGFLAYKHHNNNC